MTVFIGDDPALPVELTQEEQDALQSYEAMVYHLSVLLMRLDGNDGDPHQLIWCGGPIPEPWGDAWEKYEPQALSVIDTIGEGSARAMVEALHKVIPAPTPPASTTEAAP